MEEAFFARKDVSFALEHDIDERWEVDRVTHGSTTVPGDDGEDAEDETYEDVDYKATLDLFFSNYLKLDGGYLFTSIGNTALLKDMAVPPIMRSPLFREAVQHINVWMSGGNTSGMVHFDFLENWNCQIDGHKTFLLVPPSHGHTVRPPQHCIIGEQCPCTRFSLSEIVVLVGVPFSPAPAVPASTRICARLTGDQEHSSRVSILVQHIY